MMETKLNEDIAVVEQSLARACIAGDPFERFYQIFLSADPQIKPMFEETDFNKQNKLLKAGLANLILFAQDSDYGKLKVDEIGLSHSKAKLDIKPELYSIWLNSLLKAIAEFDSEYNEEKAQAWTRVLSSGIEKIIDAYGP